MGIDEDTNHLLYLIQSDGWKIYEERLIEVRDSLRNRASADLSTATHSALVALLAKADAIDTALALPTEEITRYRGEQEEELEQLTEEEDAKRRLDFRDQTGAFPAE